MLSKVFAVYDSAVKVYDRPFICQTEAEAIRGFMDACSDPKTMLHRHPEDYTLFLLGEYDDSLGVIRNLQAPEPLGSAQKFHPGAKKVEPKQVQLAQ